MSRRKTDHSDQDSEKFFDARDNNESLKSHTSNIDPEKTKLIIEASKKSIQVPNRLDSFLSGFSSWAGSAYNMDYSLKFLQYLAWALSKVYSSDGMRSFYTQINNTRYIMRLFGAPVSLQAIRTRSWSQGWTDERIHQVTDVMAWSMLFYYPLEHVAFTKWTAPKLMNANATKYSALSCRFWTLYVVADIGAVVLKILELNKRRMNVMTKRDKKDISEEDADKQLNTLNAMIKYQKLQAIRCLLYILPCINWSLPKWDRDPWLKEGLVNSLMFSESIVCLYQQISTL